MGRFARPVCLIAKMAVEIELDHGTLLVRSLVASPDLGVARVAERVRRGGHGVPDQVVRRRFAAGLRNLVRRSWDGEEPIAWSEIVGDGAEERYQHEERTYEARDGYRIRPGCECDSIAIRSTRLLSPSSSVLKRGTRSTVRAHVNPEASSEKPGRDIEVLPPRRAGSVRGGVRAHALRAGALSLEPTHGEVRSPARGNDFPRARHRVGRGAGQVFGAGRHLPLSRRSRAIG